jgi:hypothetical protein
MDILAAGFYRQPQVLQAQIPPEGLIFADLGLHAEGIA